MLLIITVLWFIFMTYLSHQNGAETAETSLRLAVFLGNRDLNGWLRRVAHVVVFFVLAVLISLTLWSWSLDWWLALLVMIWAVVDEATKPLVDGRHFAWIDVGLNECGSLIGIVIGAVIGFWNRSGFSYYSKIS
ncbi:MAG: VanZ family protein [Oscillospiraceae bacterium]|nr:VanZ family protein [Oscillospiraceae bacterium]